jgi:hypothetical protein
MLLGGEPWAALHRVELRLVFQGPLEQAKADWRAGRMKLPDADDKEFIPLPPDPPPSQPIRCREPGRSGYTAAHERQRLRPFQAGDRPVQFAHHGPDDRRLPVPGAAGRAA